MYRNQNNPFGFTPGGDSTGGIAFSSYASAWNAWGNNYGSRVQGVGSNANMFVSYLLIDNRGAAQPTIGGDSRGAYNSLDASTGGNPLWPTLVLGAIKGVQSRLPSWSNSCP